MNSPLKPARVHSGRVVHVMDHYVLELRTDDAAAAYVTVYDIHFMPEVGQGRVVLGVIPGPTDRRDFCLADDPDTALRLQGRLRRLAPHGLPLDLETTPEVAEIRRDVSATESTRWVAESANHRVDVRWVAPVEPFAVTAPAGSFHPGLDYSAVMVDFAGGSVAVDGGDVGGDIFDHAAWGRRLGRPLSSCHAALGETAVEAGMP